MMAFDEDVCSPPQARGIDVQQVSLVINYDLPTNRENYIHRWAVELCAQLVLWSGFCHSKFWSSLQNWSWWPFRQKRSRYQLRHWGGQEDSSGHWDVLQYNCGGDAYERCWSDLSLEVFWFFSFFFLFFKKKAVLAIVHLHCAYIWGGTKLFNAKPWIRLLVCVKSEVTMLVPLGQL